MENHKLEIKYLKYLIGLFFLYYLIYYMPYFTEGLAIKADDFNWIWGKNKFGDSLSSVFSGGGWARKSGLLGDMDLGVPLNPTEIWLKTFPPVFASNFLFVFMFSLFLWATYLFLRSWDVARIPALIAGIFATFSPGYHTFVRVGHIDKVMLNPFVMFSLAFITMMFRKSRFQVCYGLLTVFSLSMAFSDGDPQVFLFFAPFYSLYALSLFFIQHAGSRPIETETLQNQHPSRFRAFVNGCSRNLISNRKLIPVFLFIPVLTILLTLPSISKNLGQLVSTEETKASSVATWIPLSDEVNDLVETETVETALSPEEKKSKELAAWYWATQWSVPKLETIDLFVPGFFGYLSLSPTEPYWGRVGQTEGWDQHRQGYQNYFLMISYLGVFMIIFIVYAWIYCPPIVRYVFVPLLLLFLFLSYGKFSFVYRWLYDLPYMDQVRNPNRFLQLFHFTAVIVFGFGLSHYYQRMKSVLSGMTPKTPFKFFKYFFITVVVIGILVWIGIFSEEDQILAYLGARFPYQTATLIVSNMYFYWIKAMVVFSIATLLLHFATDKMNLQNYKIWVSAILLFGLLELYTVNVKFYQFEKPGQDRNNFQRLMEGEIPGFEKYKEYDVQDNLRMFFLKQNGEIKGQYYSYLYYNGNLPLKLFDYSIVRRVEDIPKQNRNYFQMLNNSDLRFLKISGIRYVFSNFPVRDPDFELIYADEIKSLNETVYFYYLKSAFPYVYIRGNAEFGHNLSSTLGRMNQSGFDIYHSVMLPEKVRDVLTEEQIKALSDHPENKIEVEKNQFSGNLVVKTDLKTPVILVMNNGYMPEWEAESGGRTLPHFSGNYLFNAFYVTPEDKEVRLKFNYKNNFYTFSLRAYLGNYAILFGVLIFMFRKSRSTSSSRNKKMD